MIKQAEIKRMKIDELELNPENPRIISPQNYMALQKSVEKFGFVGVVVWNKRSKRLVGGHQNLKILKRSGVKEIDVSVVDLPDDEEIALLIQLNNQYSQGDWDTNKALKKISSIEKMLPNMFDDLRFTQLKTELEGRMPKVPKVDEASHIPEMEIQPYEHYDYVVVLFKDSRDFLVALDWFGIKKAKRSTASGKVKIGLGRVIDGKKFLEKIK